MKHYVLLVILFTLFYRLLITFYPYSGHGKAPMYGDYEAQRHWMEITYNLNVHDWYTNTSSNDLLYWGLDYPPLTAYHSYLMGYVANTINPKFVELKTSRGYESDAHKYFMRMTVLIADLLIFFPSVILLKQQFTNSNSPSVATMLLVLLNPTIALIDHGHFQYNCISLGLMQLAIYFLIQQKNELRNYAIGSIMFCLALNYKQMELYHSLPVFFYLLSKCFHSKGLLKLLSIGSVVVLSFAMCWLPYLTSLKEALQVLHRLFPFARGLFEDKVANFWCCISVFIKLKEMYPIEMLSKASLVLTFTSVLPTCINLFLKPTRDRFILSLINCSLLFFLFSFQVHEKSILLATIPSCLLISYYPFIITWFLLISTFSMFPLLNKDGLIIPYFCTLILFFIISHEIYKKNYWSVFKSSGINTMIVKSVFILSISGAICLSLCEAFIKSPFKKYPDLWPLAICFYSFLHFILFTFLFHLIQFTLNDESTTSNFNNALFKTYDDNEMNNNKLKTQ